MNKKIVGATIEHSVPENVDYLKVDVEFYSGNKVIEKRSLRYDLNTDYDVINKDIEKIAKVIEQDLELGKKSAQIEASHKKAEETIKKLIS